MTQNHNANPPIPDALEQALWRLLSSGACYKEYELIHILVEQGFKQFTPSLEPLELFRAHFLLFHLLYRLQDKWIKEEKGTLAIHSLEIRLLSLDNASNSDLANLADFGETPEEVKNYYLDYEKFVETQEKEVIELLDSFWQSFGKLPTMPASHISIEESISILQIDGDLNTETINRQFRKLSQIHHPDKGGEPEAFRQLCEARDRLKMEI